MELSGIQMRANPWSVGGEYTLPAVLRALPLIAPPGAVLYLEAGFVTDQVGDFLTAEAASNTSKVYPGTYAPKPARFHVPATVSVLEPLDENEVCDHLVLYVGDTVLLSGYDFGFSPLHVDRAIAEDAVQEFAKRAGGRVETAA